jgi:plastocyanin
MRAALKQWACIAGLWAGVAAQAASLQVQVLDKEGTPVPDAVVVLYPEAAGSAHIPAPPALPELATIAQEKMRFVPAVTIVPAGATLRFTNLDGWEHHVRGAPAPSLTQPASSVPAGFEFKLDAKLPERPGGVAQVRVSQPGVLLLGCHIHGSMRGHVFVTDSAWTLKTDAQGLAQFQQLPEAGVRVRVWHAEQLLDLPVQTLKLGAAPAQATVQLLVVPRRRRI